MVDSQGRELNVGDYVAGAITRLGMSEIVLGRITEIYKVLSSFENATLDTGHSFDGGRGYASRELLLITPDLMDPRDIARWKERNT